MDATTTSPAPTSPSGSTGPAPYRLRWVVASVVLAANLMDVLDSTIVNVAGPSVHRDLGGSADTLQWLSAGYTLAFAVLPHCRRPAGRHPRPPQALFLVGSAGFTLLLRSVRRRADHRSPDRTSGRCRAPSAR